MRSMLLGSALLAACAVTAAPAAAQSWTSAGISSGSAFAGRSGGSAHAVGVMSGDQRRDHHDRRRNRGFDGGVIYGGWDRDYQGDSAWRPNSFNDWWHERPNRAFPRWMQNNQNCERQWWGGGQWRC